MATSQAQVLKVIARVDPYMKDGTLTASGTISTWASSGGDKFTAQGLVDVYNDARYALWQALVSGMTRAQLTKYVGGLISTSNVSFSSGTGAKPSGFLLDVSFQASDGQNIAVLPLSVKDYTDALETNNLYIVYEVGTNFVAPSSTYLPDGNAPLYYFNLSDLALAGVSAGNVNETYDVMWLPILVELAVAIANGLGRAEALDLARNLIKGSIG